MATSDRCRGRHRRGHPPGGRGARRYGRPLERHAKQGTDFATSADLASEAAIRAVVTAHRPDDAMIGEEDGRSGPDDAAREWLVDPLCGTRNFAATTPLVAVNVALIADPGSLAAASADPISGEVFWTDGAGGLGTPRRDRHPARPQRQVPARRPRPGPRRRRPELPPHVAPDVPARLPAAGQLHDPGHDLAGGRSPGRVPPRGRPARERPLRRPVAIARAAGCVVTGIHGQPLDVAPYGLLAAADPDTHAALLALVLDR